MKTSEFGCICVIWRYKKIWISNVDSFLNVTSIFQYVFPHIISFFPQFKLPPPPRSSYSTWIPVEQDRLYSLKSSYTYVPENLNQYDFLRNNYVLKAFLDFFFTPRGFCFCFSQHVWEATGQASRDALGTNRTFYHCVFFSVRYLFHTPMLLL